METYENTEIKERVTSDPHTYEDLRIDHQDRTPKVVKKNRPCRKLMYSLMAIFVMAIGAVSIYTCIIVHQQSVTPLNGLMEGQMVTSGLKGYKGQKGDDGDFGHPGIQRQPGPKGSKGLRGAKGDKGARGENGSDGQQGVKGDRGEVGVPGPQGDIDLPGPPRDCEPSNNQWRKNLTDHVLGIRLRDGSATHGRVEINIEGAWSTVCDDGFGTADARVACRQLGLTGDDYFTIGGGSGNIGLDDVNCTGAEAALVDCRHLGVNTHGCSHHEDVGVGCRYPEQGPPGDDRDPSNCLEWQRNRTDRALGIRLRDGSATSGRVEVYIGGVWSTVCDDTFGTVDVRVVCRQLGLTGDNYFTIGGGSGNIGLDDVNCLGAEAALVDCGHAGVNTHDCSHIEDVGVMCRYPEQNRLEWQRNLPDYVRGIRLRGGSATRGRVEVFIGGVWSTVCQDNFGAADARVTCRQLGLNGEGYFTIGGGSGKVGLDELYCTGDEAALVDCMNKDTDPDDCNHDEDVGVECTYP